jgi:hypothetical protein
MTNQEHNHQDLMIRQMTKKYNNKLPTNKRTKTEEEEEEESSSSGRSCSSSSKTAVLDTTSGDQKNLVTSGHVQIKKEDESMDNNTTVVPNNATSSISLKNHGKSRSQQIKDEVLDSFVQDAKVKQEGSAITLSHEERSNRYVFRRGCHEQCITTVLGGSSMGPFPIVKNPPPLDDQEDFPKPLYPTR